MRYLSFILFLLAFVSGFAQDSKLDSLSKLLPKVENENRVDVLAALSLEYNADNKDSVKKYSDEALELARKLNYKKGEGMALYSLAFYYYSNIQFPKAIETIEAALAINLSLGDSLTIARTYSIYAAIEQNLSKYSEAIEHYKLANSYLGGIAEKRRFKNYEGLGIAEYNLANYNSALKYVLKVIKYYEQENRDKDIPDLYGVIGSIYIKTAEKELGLNYFKRAIQLSREQKNDFVLTRSLFAIGEYYKDEGQIDTSLYYLNKAIIYARKINQKLLISDIFTDKGDCFLSVQEYDSASIYYHKVIQLAEKSHDNWAIVYGNLGLAKVNKARGNYGKSLYYLHKVKPIAEEISSKEMLLDLYVVFSEVNALNGNYKEAYKYQLLYKEISSSLHDENMAKQLADLKVSYESEKKEQENKSLIAENRLKEQTIKNQEFIVVGVVVVLLLAIVLAFVFFRGKEKIRKANILLKEKNQEIQNQNEEITVQAEELSEAYTKLKELDKFKEGLTNMIVHDLKNPLNIILNLAQENLVLQAGSKMLTLITNILDIAKFEEAKMPIKQKKTNLRKLLALAIEKTSFVAGVSGIELINNVDENLLVEVDFDLTERIFINLLTNAIKFSPKNEKVYINSQDDNDNNFVKIFVEDSGRGVPEEFQDKIFERFTQVTAINSASMRSTGLGLTFCKLAVEAHGGTIGVKNNTESGAVFWFSLPKA